MPYQDQKKSLITWILILLSGLLLLAGRYHWETEVIKYSFRSFFASAYFFCWFLPTLYYLLLFLGVSKRLVKGITFVSFIIQTLPIHLLGLERFNYYVNKPTMIYWNHINIKPELNWFPDALKKGAVIPHEHLVFFLIFAAMGVLFAVYQKYLRQTPLSLKNSSYIILIVCAIIFQTWLHLSLRSPNTYRPFFYGEGKEDSWYHYYLFPDGKGAVNGDYFVFRYTEEVFLNNSGPLENTLLPRAFPMYLSSQFSYFFNDFHVWLFINIFAWATAVYVLSQLALKNFGYRAALFTALFATFSPVFIQYAAQSMSYVFVYFTTTLLVLLFYELFTRKSFSYANSLLFGGVMGLALLTFEFQPWILVFLILAYLQKMPWKKTILSVVIAGLCPYVFLKIMNQFGTAKVLDNAQVIYASLGTIIEVFTKLHLSQLYQVLVDFSGSYPRNLFSSFQISLFLALITIFFVQLTLAQRFCFALLLLPSLLTQIFFQFDGPFPFHYQNSPRILASAFPAIYLLAGLALAKFLDTEWSLRNRKMAISLVCFLIGIQVFISNVDVFGFPVVYYLLHWSRPAPWIL